MLLTAQAMTNKLRKHVVIHYSYAFMENSLDHPVLLDNIDE